MLDQLQRPLPLRWILNTSPLQVVLAALVVACCVGALFFVSLQQIRDDAWREAKIEGRNLVGILGRDIGRLVGTFDLSLRAAADGMSLPGIHEMPPALRQAALFDRAPTGGGYGGILVLNETGDVVFDARSDPPRRGNFAAREYFRVHRDGAAAGLFIGAPMQALLRKTWIVPMSRAIRGPDGAFRGVVVAALDLDVLQDMFAAVQLNPASTMALHHTNGTTILKAPFRLDDIGRDVSQGVAFQRFLKANQGQLVARAVAVDGVERLYSFMHIPGAPLIVNVGLSTEQIDRNWQARVWPSVYAFGVVIVVLAAAACLLAVSLRRRRRVEAALVESEAKFRLLAENSFDMVSRIGPDDVRRYVSPSCARLLGLAPEDLLGRRLQEGIHPEDLRGVEAAIRSLHAGKVEEAALTYRAQHADGHWLWLESTVRVIRGEGTGQFDGLVAISRDVTQRKELEDRLMRLASTDGLTGLMNRRTFDEALDREWHRGQRDAQPLSLLLVDIDLFKALNDSQGHPRGDECLRQVAACLRGTTRRATDLVVRYGGEEFVLLLPETDVAGAEQVAERVRAEVEALGLSHPSGGLNGVVTVSVGAATVLPLVDAPTWPATLTNAADRALYVAKRSGRNRVVHAMLNQVGQLER